MALAGGTMVTAIAPPALALTEDLKPLGGASLVYFTGVRWNRSERLTGASPTALAMASAWKAHEPINLVRGEQTRLAPGMCFSDEPGIYIPGQFGIRLEDCIYMTERGPAWFSKPPPSLDRPLG